MLQKGNSIFSTAGLSPLEFLGITQSASIATYAWLGRGDKNAGDAAAVDAMRRAFDTIPALGVVVVGEGEKDEAPMLYVGERVGNGEKCVYDVVVDPLEGTRLLANDKPNAISVMGIAPHGAVYAPAESFYMEKLVVSSDVAKVIDIEAPVDIILRDTARVLGKDIADLTVFVLEKPRHADLIASIYRAGAKVQLHTDGDVSGALLALDSTSSIDIMMGIGGTPEGVLTACAMRAIGGELFARFAPQSEEERLALNVAGIDIAKRMTAHDLVQSDDVLFLATGVTDGQLLSGITPVIGGYKTHSILMQGWDKRTLHITEVLGNTLE